VTLAPEEVPELCTMDQTAFGGLPSSTLPMYRHAATAPSDSITIEGLTVKTWNSDPLFP